MRNRLSIFSSRLLGSALLWAVLVVGGIEYSQSRHLPQQYSSHEVDTLLQRLERPMATAPVLMLGDSVARQIGSELATRHRDKITSLACNAAVETAGQYFILKRYAEHNPLPAKVVLMMGSPLGGDLNTEYTENFVTRCFLQWSEIASIAVTKRDPVFTARMLAYKLLPSLRYRIHLQKIVPGLNSADVYYGERESRDDARQAPLLLPSSGSRVSIAAVYFKALVAFLQQRGVPVVFVWRPQAAPTDIVSTVPPPPPDTRLVQLALDYPLLHVIHPPRFYPKSWFGDGVHFKSKPLQQVVDDYTFLVDPHETPVK